MIRNERQYRITRAQALNFEAALEQLLARAANDRTTHPRLLKAQEDALRSQLESLREELRDYEELKSGDVPPPDLSYIARVPQDLIRARIASGMSQRELAELLEMPEQQIQRYEATEYESVSLARILEISDALKAAQPLQLERAGAKRSA